MQYVFEVNGGDMTSRMSPTEFAEAIHEGTFTVDVVWNYDPQVKLDVNVLLVTGDNGKEA